MTNNKCPLCKSEGGEASRTEVENLIKKYFRKHLKSFKYSTCTKDNCSIAYYNNDNDEIYFQRDLED